MRQNVHFLARPCSLGCLFSYELSGNPEDRFYRVGPLHSSDCNTVCLCVFGPGIVIQFFVSSRHGRAC